jgi:hypothetical protein
MPAFKVTSPDGRVISVDAPDGTSQSDLIRMAQDRMAAAPSPMTSDEKFLASPGGRTIKGWKDPIDAGAQMLPRALSEVVSIGGLAPNRASQWLDSEAAKVDSGIKNSEQDYQTARFKGGQSGFDGFRTVGNVVNPATLAIARISPSAAKTVIGRSAQGFVAGGLGGLLATPVTDKSETSFGMAKAGQAVSGAVGGALFAPIAGAAVDFLAPKFKQIWAAFHPDAIQKQASEDVNSAITAISKDSGIGPDGGSVQPGTIQALRETVLTNLKNGYKIDPAAQLRKMDFDAQGVPALRGQITRDPSQYSRDLNVRGIEGAGEPVQNILSAQNQKITSDIAKFGGQRAAEPFQAGQIFNSSLKKLDDSMMSQVRRAYQNVRASTGKDWEVPLGGLANDVQGVVDDFGVGAEKNAIPSAIYSRLKSLGITNDGGMTQRKVFNFEEADKLLKQINAHDDGMNASIGALRASVKKALLEDAGADDPFALPRKMAYDRFKQLDAVPALEAAAKAQTPQDLARLSDDFVQKHILGARVADLRALSSVLPAEAKDEARKQIASAIYRGAFRGNASGDKLASPAGLQDALNKIGTDRLKVFFSDAEIGELQRLSRIAAYANTEPAWGTVARGGNPGGVLAGGIAKLTGLGSGLAGAMPLIGAANNSLRASVATSNAIPKAPNLTPQEIAQMAGLLNVGSVGVGGLLAPRP